MDQLVPDLVPEEVLYFWDVYFLQLFFLISSRHKIDLNVVGALIEAGSVGPYIIKYNFLKSNVFETESEELLLALLRYDILLQILIGLALLGYPAVRHVLLVLGQLYW